MKTIATLFLAFLIIAGCSNDPALNVTDDPGKIPFTWNNANIYFLLTDRFLNGDPDNDLNFDRSRETAVNRGFMGGDLAGVTKKINEGYFNDLGITAIWMTPFVEQNKGLVDEGTGDTYGYHGYWSQDWTALDPNFGTEEELAKLVEAAHAKGIRIIMDVVINHTGPVTPEDPVWGEEWVRTGPPCAYKDYRSTVTCTLVENLPDIRTEDETDVMLPAELLEKWEKEGRLDQELAELDAFFNETGYPRAPKYYIIKWLTDYIRKYGFNAYRLDTAKHTEEGVWAILRKEADRAYEEWKADHPGVFPKDDPFYMVGEVYNYNISGGHFFDFGDTLVDFYAEGIDHLINFEFKYDATRDYEYLFSKYSSILNDALKENGVVNYLSSHDDGSPYDKMRTKALKAGTKLLLSPGACQVYYGDETSRILVTEGAEGDANLRSFMNWDALENDETIGDVTTQTVHSHYQRLGQFRKLHPSVGAGKHEMISEEPYVFKRTYAFGDLHDAVVIGIDMEPGKKTIQVKEIFEDGTTLVDSYSGTSGVVENGSVTIDSDAPIVLLGLY